MAYGKSNTGPKKTVAKKTTTKPPVKPKPTPSPSAGPSPMKPKKLTQGQKNTQAHIIRHMDHQYFSRAEAIRRVKDDIHAKKQTRVWDKFTTSAEDNTHINSAFSKKSVQKRFGQLKKAGYTNNLYQVRGDTIEEGDPTMDTLKSYGDYLASMAVGAYGVDKESGYGITKNPTVARYVGMQLAKAAQQHKKKTGAPLIGSGLTKPKKKK